MTAGPVEPPSSTGLVSEPAESAGASPHDVDGQGKGDPGRRQRHWPKRLGLLLLAWVVVGGMLPAVAAVLPLQGGRTSAQAAEAALRDGSFTAAHGHLQDAHDSFRAGRRILRNPVAWTGGLLPGVGHNLRAAGAIAEAGELTAAAGARSLAAVLSLDGGMEALAPRGGALPLTAIAELVPALEMAVAELVRAEEVARQAPSLLLVGPVASAREVLLDRLDGLAEGALRAHRLADVLPGYLGAAGTRRYLFGASNPSEMRGTGGFVGAFSVLTVQDGRLDFAPFVSIHDMPKPSGAVGPPDPEFGARYDRYGGASEWLAIDLTPHGPWTAEAFANLYERSAGPIDGVIIADPFAIAALMRVSGPVDFPGHGVLDAGTVVEYVTPEAYGDFDASTERREVLGEVAGAALVGFLRSGGDDPRRSMEALADAVDGGHLLLYSSDPSEQDGLEQAGVSGGLPEAPEVLVPVLNSSSNSKIDYYLHQEITYDVTLLDAGGARGRVEARLRNDAPTSGQPGYVIGPNLPDLEVGQTRFVYTMFCGAGCEVLAADRDGEVPDRASVESERGLTLVNFPRVELRSGESTTLRYEWETSGAWTGDAGALTYTLHTKHQPFVAGTRTTVRVNVPAGMEPTAVPQGAEVRDGVVEFIVEEVGRRRHEVGFALPPGQLLLHRIGNFLARPAFRLGR